MTAERMTAKPMTPQVMTFFEGWRFTIDDRGADDGEADDTLHVMTIFDWWPRCGWPFGFSIRGSLTTKSKNSSIFFFPSLPFSSLIILPLSYQLLKAFVENISWRHSLLLQHSWRSHIRACTFVALPHSCFAHLPLSSLWNRRIFAICSPSSPQQTKP